MMLIVYRPTRYRGRNCHWCDEPHAVDSEMFISHVGTREEAIREAARIEFADSQSRSPIEFWLIRQPTADETQQIADCEFEGWDHEHQSTIHEAGDLIREELRQADDFRAAVEKLRVADATAKKAKADAEAEVARHKQAEAAEAAARAKEAEERAQFAALRAKYGPQG